MKRSCDVCIIGAGPAGLATLSAINEPYTLDSMNPVQVHNASTSMRYNKGVGPTTKKICVVDPNGDWLEKWNDNFSRLGIKYLRSPSIAHPDHFDMNSLLAYAVANGREDELIESGCAKIRKLHGLGQTQVGLWKLPSTELFRDFCANLAKQLPPHDFVKGTAVDLTKNDNLGGIGADNADTSYTVTLCDGSEIRCNSVVLALGPTGKPVIPEALRAVPNDRIIQWDRMKEYLEPHHKRVLVVGGGLTAVQVAQYCLRSGKQVVLCSRRPLVERHFDIDICWVDRRSAGRQISDFYHQPEEDRLAALKEVRGGGSVPPIYMDDIRKWEARGNLSLINGIDAKYIQCKDDGEVVVAIGNDETSFDCIILATGIIPDCLRNPLVKRYQEKCPCKIVGGFPSVSVDLEWSKNLFVVGALASLNVGPDGGNIMGARRAASIVANSLECKSWLRDSDSGGALGGALCNSFQLFWDEDDSSSDDSDSD